MKWHVICLVTIFLLAVNPIECASQLTIERGAFCSPFTITVPASHHGVNYLFWWAHWSAAVLAYGACHFDRLRTVPRSKA